MRSTLLWIVTQRIVVIPYRRLVSRTISPHPGRIACCSAPNSRPPATKALHTICGNNTSIVSSSWWWAYTCPKHVQQIISAIKHSVSSSWIFSLRECSISLYLRLIRDWQVVWSCILAVPLYCHCLVRHPWKYIDSSYLLSSFWRPGTN